MHVELAVEVGVVPPPHVFERREFDLLGGPPRTLLADEFGRVEVVDRLGEDVAVAVGDGSVGGHSAELDDAVGVGHRHVVRAVIRVMRPDR
jgi:hypothetical protein